MDILLVFVIHFTNKSRFPILAYALYHAVHSDGKAHGGTALIIKSSNGYHEIDKYQKEYLQTISRDGINH
jgi:hypothetical protein